MNIVECDVIKHQRMMDVALYVTGVIKNGTEIVIEGRWVNLGQTRSYFIGLPRTTFRIPSFEFRAWMRADDPNAIEVDSIRNLRWVSCL